MATNSSTTSDLTQERGLPPGVFAALLPRRNRPTPTALTAFPGGIADVITPDADLLYNKYDLLCPRPECGSIILRTGVGKLVERPSIQVRSNDMFRQRICAILPTPSAKLVIAPPTRRPSSTLLTRKTTSASPRRFRALRRGKRPPAATRQESRRWWTSVSCVKRKIVFFTFYIGTSARVQARTSRLIHFDS
jgi:hypothetical protein